MARTLHIIALVAAALLVLGCGGDGEGGGGGGGDGGFGDPCTGVGDCGGVSSTSVECVEEITQGTATILFPGGYCTATCFEAGDCGTGATCSGFAPGELICLKECTDVSDCRETEGYECRDRLGSTETFCQPPRG